MEEPAAAQAGVPDGLAERVGDEAAGVLAAHERAARNEHRQMNAVDRERLVGEAIGHALDEYANATVRAGGRPLHPTAEARVRRAVRDRLLGLGGLQALLDDPRIENININGCDQVFVAYTDGTRARLGPVAGSDGELVELLRGIAATAGLQERRFDRAAPLLSLQLPDGARLFATLDVSARPCVAIRRFPLRHASLPELVERGTIDAGLHAFLAAAVRARKRMLITGGTGVGKTTMVRALAGEIAPAERLITIEDTLELGLHTDPARHPDVVALQAREANIEGAGEVSLSELLRATLRMSPDRIIVGEVRGPEFVPMCNAMNSGCTGSMSTLHAETSGEVFAKLAAYAAQGPERLPVEATGLLVASAIDLIVHLAFTTPPSPAGPGAGQRGVEQAAGTDFRSSSSSLRGWVRVVSSIREVIDFQDGHLVTNEIYAPGPDKRARPAAPLRQDTLDELEAAGLDAGWLRQPQGWWTP